MSWHTHSTNPAIDLIVLYTEMRRVLWRAVSRTHTVHGTLKPGFHYPISRPEFTGRVDGPWTRVHFLTPELTARVDGCQKMYQSWRAIGLNHSMSGPVCNQSSRPTQPGHPPVGKCNEYKRNPLCVAVSAGVWWNTKEQRWMLSLWVNMTCL